MLVKKRSILLMVGLLATLLVGYFRSTVGYLSPDELYFTEFENLWDAEIRYVIPIIIFSLAWSLGFYGAAVVNFFFFYLFFRRQRNFALLAVIASPFILFYFSSYLREIVVCLVIYYIVFVPCSIKSKFLLAFVLFVLRPEHFLVTVIPLAVAMLSKRRALCFAFFFIVALVACVILIFFSEWHYNYITRLADLGDFYQQHYGVLSSVDMRNVSFVDVFVNYIILLFSFPVQSEGFLRFSMYMAFVFKVFMALIIFRHILMNKYLSLPVATGVNILSMFMLIALFQSHELSASRWFLPCFFVFIGVCAHIMPRFGLRGSNPR